MWNASTVQAEPNLPEPRLSMIRDSQEAPRRGARPYRLFGLCVSLVFISILTLVYSVGAAFLAYGLRFGWARLSEIMTSAIHPTESGGNALDLIVADLGSASQAPLIASILIYVGLSLAILAMARWRAGAAWRDTIGWHAWSIAKAGRGYWLIVAIALVYGIGANLLIAYWYPPSKDWFNVPKDNLSSAFVLFALAAIFAPVAEEFMFRGWIFTSLRAQFGLWVSLLISSAIFASLHYEKTHIYALAVFPIGLCLGLMRERAGSLKGSIVFHAFYNALAFCLAALDIA